MVNLTTLLQFIQDNHEKIYSVYFKRYMLPSHIVCVITLKGTIFGLTDTRRSESADIIGLINLFMARFGAMLHADFSCDNLKIFVVSEFNTDKNGKDNKRNEK